MCITLEHSFLFSFQMNGSFIFKPILKRIIYCLHNKLSLLELQERGTETRGRKANKQINKQKINK